MTPLQIIDLKGLMGDASDNIPGIPGVGEKTALKLLHQFGSVEEVLSGTGELKGKMKEKIEAHAEDARMSKQLATIHREVPLEQTWEDMQFDGLKEASAGPALAKLEFKSLLERLSFSGSVSSEQEAVPAAEVESTIATEENLAELIDALGSIDVLHVETHGDNPHQAKLVGLAVGAGEKYMYISPELLQSDVAAPVREWLANSDQPKRGYDLHRVDLALHAHGIEFAGAAFDVQLAAYLLDPTESNQTISGLTSKYGLPSLVEDDAVMGKGAKYKVPEADVLSDFLCRKAAALAAIIPLQEQALESDEMKSLFHELEMPLSRILADMEKQGIKANTADLQALGSEFEEQIGKLMAEIYKLSGTEFNLNSPRQLGEILFDKLGLPVVKKQRPATRQMPRCWRSWPRIMMWCSIFCNIVSLPSCSLRMLKVC